MPHITFDDLASFATELLVAGGATSEEAHIVGPSLARSDALGYASHGVMRISFYLDMLQRGDLVSGVPLEIITRSPGAIAADGQWGFGQVQMNRLVDLAMEQVRESGVAVATLRRSGHIGRLGDYVEHGAREGYVAQMMVNTHGAARRVAPPGGKEPRLGTNPMAFGVPFDPNPIVLDFSTSATAEGKVRVHHMAGTACPPGWLVDRDGRPTTDPATLYGDPPGSIVPFGADQAYKGFGLGLMVEILSGALSGGLCARELPETPKGNCAMLVLIDPRALGGRDHFEQETRQLVDFVRSCKTVDPNGEILLPGDPELRRRAQVERSGVSLSPSQWERLTELAERLGVPAPRDTAQRPK